MIVNKIPVVKPVFRDHLWIKEKVALLDSGSIHMQFSMTGQEKGAQVTT